MGSGKSHVGQRLAQQLNFDFIDLDDFLEQGEGTTISLIFETKGAAYFRKAEQKYLKALASKTQTVIATGGGTPCFFDNMAWINQHGVSIYLKASVEVLAQRLQTEMAHRPLLIGQTIHTLQTFIQHKLQTRSVYYEKAHHSIVINETNQLVVPQIIQKIHHPT